jgi:hypothetical protein
MLHFYVSGIIKLLGMYLNVYKMVNLHTARCYLGDFGTVKYQQRLPLNEKDLLISIIRHC